MAVVYGLELTRGGEFEFADVDDYPEANGMTFKKHDFVKLNTSGQVEDALDTENIFGIALKDASTTEDTMIPVLRVNRDMQFVASQSNAGATQVTAQTQVGLQCSWIKSTQTDHTDKITVDTGDVGHLNVEIIKLDPRDVVGTSDGRVIFRIVPDVISAR